MTINPPIVVLQGDALVQADVRANPTNGFGVNASMMRITEPCRTSMVESAYHLIHLQLSGPVLVDVQLGNRRLKHMPARGSIGIMPQRIEENIAEIQGSLNGIVLQVSPECLALAGAQVARPGGMLVAKMSGTDDVLFALGQALEVEVRAGHPNGLLYWSTLADAVIRHLVAQHLSSPAIQVREALDPRAVARVDDYIRANLDAPLNLVSLAAVAGCDRFRFARGFRKTTGLTPHRYITRLRLLQARALIMAEQRTLAEVALATGFFDQSHMTHWFRRVYGLTPGRALGEQVALSC